MLMVFVGPEFLTIENNIGKRARSGGLRQPLTFLAFSAIDDR